MLRFIIGLILFISSAPLHAQAWNVGAEREVDQGYYLSLVYNQNGWRVWRTETTGGAYCRAVKSARGRPHPTPIGVGDILWQGTPFLIIRGGGLGDYIPEFRGRWGRAAPSDTRIRRSGDRFWKQAPEFADLYRRPPGTIEVNLTTFEYDSIRVGRAEETAELDLVGLEAALSALAQCDPAIRRSPAQPLLRRAGLIFGFAFAFDTSQRRVMEELEQVRRAVTQGLPVISRDGFEELARARNLDWSSRMDMISWLSNRESAATVLGDLPVRDVVIANSSGPAGEVTYQALVNPAGRAVSCEVLTPIASAELSAATCPIVIREAEFTPALGDDGSPTSASYVGPFNWTVDLDRFGPPEPFAPSIIDLLRSASAAAPENGAATRTTPQSPIGASASPTHENPSRHWVQVATGRVNDFRFEWRFLGRLADGELANFEPFVARWGYTNRLLVGPFANAREANAFVSLFQMKGIRAFRFTSSEGEEVIALN